MSGEAEREDERIERVRLRLSVRADLLDVLNQIGDALHLDQHTVALYALSLGARQLHLASFPNVKQMKEVYEMQIAQGVENDTGIPLSQR